MAKLDQMPDMKTIVAFRGKVDFYLWKGIPVARAWPRAGNQPNTPAQVENRQRFGAAAKVTGALPDSVRLLFDSYIDGNDGVTWTDFQRSLARGNDWFASG